MTERLDGRIAAIDVVGRDPFQIGLGDHDLHPRLDGKSLHGGDRVAGRDRIALAFLCDSRRRPARSEEHTSELQSLMRISYAVFCLKKKKRNTSRPSQITVTQSHHLFNTPRTTPYP